MALFFRKALLLSLVLPSVFGFKPSRRRHIHLLKSKRTNDRLHNNALSIRGGSDLEMATEAFGWCANLGAPAALVGGAVLATLMETRQDMAPKKRDSIRTRRVKQFQRFLLLSAFALEILSIFATTVTGTILLTQGDRPTGNQYGQEYHSPMGFLHHNHHFEYLTARITFLQGLFNWLAATALELAIPIDGEGEAARRMNAFISATLVSMILLMLSFYNVHMSFYQNYAHMLWVYTKVVWGRYIWTWPIRPMAYLYVPSMVYTLVAGYRAFNSPSDLDEDD